MGNNTNFAVCTEQDEDDMFIGSVLYLPGCHAEGKTKKEMLKNLRQVFKLCLRNKNLVKTEKIK